MRHDGAVLRSCTTRLRWPSRAAEKTEVAVMKLERAGERHRNVAQVFIVENEMNLSTKEVKAVVAAIEAATSAVICGTVGRAEYDKAYVDAVQLILQQCRSGSIGG